MKVYRLRPGWVSSLSGPVAASVFRPQIIILKARLGIKSVGHSHNTLFEDAPTHVFTLISCCRQKWMFMMTLNIKSAVIVWCLLNEEASMFMIICPHFLLDVSSLGCDVYFNPIDIGKNSPPRYWADTAGKTENAEGSENTERSLGRKYHGKWDSDYIYLDSFK